jgi:hypothetical protein
MPEEANVERGLISTSSPIGRAILNKEEGDEIKRHHAQRRPPIRARQADYHSRRRTVNLSFPVPGSRFQVRFGTRNIEP